MAEDVWHHDLGEGAEAERLRLMSTILDPSSRGHLATLPVQSDWRCLEIGAGNGSLSQWLAGRLRPPRKVRATDIATDDLMAGIESPTLDVAQLDVVADGLPSKAYDLVLIRALLHHLPERMDVLAAMVDAVRPGGWMFVQEPDLHPTLTVEPEGQAQFWREFLAWAASHRIDYHVGRKVAPRLQELGCERITVEGHTCSTRVGRRSRGGGGWGSPRWRRGCSTRKARDKQRLGEFFTLNEDPTYWTWTICFTAVTAQRPRST